MIHIDTVLAICAGFSCICVAVGWLIKIIKAVKKPNDDINAKLDRDNKRILAMEDEMRYLKASVTLLIQDDRVILNHLRTNNSTGEIAEREAAIDKFLLERD